MAKPPPFRRPSIDLDRPQRRWRTVRADQLRAGDTVAGHGTLQALVLMTGPRLRPSVELFFPAGVQLMAADAEVFVFQETAPLPPDATPADELLSD